MRLKEEYGASFNLKYRYLTPNDAFETSVLIKLAELYPDKFELRTERITSSRDQYVTYLIIKEDDDGDSSQ